MPSSTLAAEVRSEIAYAKVTQRQLAKLLGIHEATLSKKLIEYGRYAIDPEFAARVREILKALEKKPRRRTRVAPSAGEPASTPERA